MLSPNFFNTVFVFPILNILVVLYKLFLLIKLPGAFGWAIIGLTIIVRLLLHPFFKQQLLTTKKMQELKPHLDKLSEKHKNDKKRLQQEHLKLYQQAGINPASGCLFLLIQFPIFIALFNTLSLFLGNGGAKVINQINQALYWPWLKIQSIDPWFFGFNLAATPANAKVWYYYLVPIITSLLQYWQTKVSLPVSSSAQALKNKEATVGKSDASDFQKAMNTQMKYIFPVMIGWFSYTLPIGLSLYWNIFSLFSIIQYSRLKQAQESKLKAYPIKSGQN